jgi:hypothetical protein
MYFDGEELRPVTPDELAGTVAEIDQRRDRGDHFDVVVWVIAPDAERRTAYERAGATWLIDGPAPGADWLDDAMAIATEGPPTT